jgi:hypothetical protein
MAKPAREPHLPPLQRPLPVSSGAQSRRRQVTGDTVPATKLARHLDLTHQRIHQLVDEHVIVQLPDGRFDMDDARIRYVRWLRDPERRSARTQADAEHVKAKTEMLQLKLAEKRRELVRQSDVDALIDELVGVTLTAMSSMPARCAPRGDLATRRCIERVVFEVRTEIANIAQRKADECGEPPLSEQG